MSAWRSSTPRACRSCTIRSNTTRCTSESSASDASITYRELTEWVRSRTFLETIFTKTSGSPSSTESRVTIDPPNGESGPPRQLRELYKRAKLLFDLSMSPFRSSSAPGSSTDLHYPPFFQSLRKNMVSSGQRRRSSVS